MSLRTSIVAIYFLNPNGMTVKSLKPLTPFLKKNLTSPSPFCCFQKRSYLRRLNLCQVGGIRIFTEKMCFFFLPSLTSEERDLYVSQIILRSGENLHIGAHALFWGIEKEENYVKSYYHAQFLKNKLYKHVSVRNHKTFQYLVDQK